MATSQEAAALIVQQLKAGYADSYSAVGHVVDRASVTLTGQPSATTRQLAALNVQAAAEAAARNQPVVTVGALSLMATAGAVGGVSVVGGTTSGGSLSGGVVPVLNGGLGGSVGGVGALVAGGAVLAAALPTASSALGRALLAGSSSVAGAVPFRSTALPGIGTQSTPTVYRIATGTPTVNKPVGTPYGTPNVSLVNGTATSGTGQNSSTTAVPPGTLLPDGTLAGSATATGAGTAGVGAGASPDLAGLGSLGVTSDPTGTTPGVELAGLSKLDGAVKTPDLGSLGGGGIPGGAGGLGGVGGGLGGLGAGAVRSVAYGDVAAMSSASSAMSAPMAGMGSAGASSMGGMMPMMPMGGGAAAGDQGGNRRVPAWLVETEDVWGESAAVAPGVIGDGR